MRSRARRAKRSSDFHLGARIAALARIVDPGEDELARISRNDWKSEVRIRGDARAELRTEYLGAVVAAHELADHVAWNRLAYVVDAKPGLHRVPERDPHFERLAGPNRRRKLHAREGHRVPRHVPSRHAAIVTEMSATAA